MDAYDYRLQVYMDKVDSEQEDYENMLDELRVAEPEEYEDIIDYYGFGDADLTKILGDI